MEAAGSEVLEHNPAPAGDAGDPDSDVTMDVAEATIVPAPTDAELRQAEERRRQEHLLRREGGLRLVRAAGAEDTVERIFRQSAAGRSEEMAYPATLRNRLAIC